MKPEDFDAALATFVRLTQEAVNARLAREYPDAWDRLKPLITIERGRRYAKVIDINNGGRSVRCFVDTTNGNILKADGWKKPASGARGNIFNLDPRTLGTSYRR
jgi:hypothetical protein